MANRFLRGRCDGTRRLIEYAKERGWSVSTTKSSHLRFTKKGRTPVFFGSTPSDHRAYRNCMAQLRLHERQAEEAASGEVVA